MSNDMIELTIVSTGHRLIEVDRAEYEEAKDDGSVDHFLDVHLSDVDTTDAVFEPDGAAYLPANTPTGPAEKSRRPNHTGTYSHDGRWLLRRTATGGYTPIGTMLDDHLAAYVVAALNAPEPGVAEDAFSNEETWHEFHGGPWDGKRVEIEPSPDGYEHLIPARPEPGIGGWFPEDAHPDSSRYVRTGSYGETTVMTWRHVSAADRCPACQSPAPNLHPAVQHEGEVQVCRDPWHQPVGAQ